jgi:hypothetical protein
MIDLKRFDRANSTHASPKVGMEQNFNLFSAV